MRIALITDIHEDFKRLEMTCKALDNQGYDMLVCLGDITGYSPLFYSHQPDANACIDLLREKAHLVIAGNHDLYTFARLPSYHLQKNIPHNWYQLPPEERGRISNQKIWLYQEEILPVLSHSNAAFLESLKEWDTLEDGKYKYLFSHFFQPDLAGVGKWFPYNSLEIQAHFRFMKELNCKLSFTGHAHPPVPITVNRLFWSHGESETFCVKRHHKAIICPALVGERFPGSYLIFDTAQQQISTLSIF